MPSSQQFFLLNLNPSPCLWIWTLLPCSLLPAREFGLVWCPKCPHLEEAGAGERPGWVKAELLPLFLRELYRLLSHLLSAEEEGKSLQGVFAEDLGQDTGERWGVIGAHWAWHLSFAQMNGSSLPLCPHFHLPSHGMVYWAPHSLTVDPNLLGGIGWWKERGHWGLQVPRDGGCI